MEPAHLREEGIGDPDGHGPQGQNGSGNTLKMRGPEKHHVAGAEVLGLVGVMLVGVFAMRRPMLTVGLVARGCLSRLMVVKDQFAGRVV